MRPSLWQSEEAKSWHHLRSQMRDRQSSYVTAKPSETERQKRKTQAPTDAFLKRRKSEEAKPAETVREQRNDLEQLQIAEAEARGFVLSRLSLWMASSSKTPGFDATIASGGVCCKKMPAILKHSASAQIQTENAQKPKTSNM